MAANQLIDTELVIAQHLASLPLESGDHYCAWEFLDKETKEDFCRQARELLKRSAVLTPVGSLIDIVMIHALLEKMGEVVVLYNAIMGGPNDEETTPEAGTLSQLS